MNSITFWTYLGFKDRKKIYNKENKSDLVHVLAVARSIISVLLGVFIPYL